MTTMTVATSPMVPPTYVLSSPPLFIRPRIVRQEKSRGRYTPAKAADDADGYFKKIEAAGNRTLSARGHAPSSADDQKDPRKESEVCPKATAFVPAIEEILSNIVDRP